MNYEVYQNIPLSSFDLYAIGVALVIVMTVLGLRRLWRMFNGPR